MKKIKTIAIFLAASLITTSCDTVDFGDINTDPNSPTTAVPSQLLTQAQKYIGGTENNTKSKYDVYGVLNAQEGLLYTQQLTQGQYPSYAKYSITEASYNRWYINPLQNLNKIIEINQGELAEQNRAYGNNNNQIAVAKLLRAYFLNYMTDTWGAIPYSEAFKGIKGSQAKFDSQESIYNTIFADIDDAIDRINNGKGSVGDFIFGGNMDKWKTFANTMKLVFAMRISDANPTLAKTKFEEAVASGSLINSNANNLLYPYGNSEDSDNPWEDRFESREDYMLSETLVESLRSKLDPRLFKYGDASRTGTASNPKFLNNIDSKYVGGPNGKVNGNTQDYSLITSKIIKVKAYKAPIYTLAQTKLTLAEGALKGWNAGGKSAEKLLKEGIEASMKQWGVDNTDITKYTKANTSATIKDIAYEKWVALFMNGHEAWAEWRRLDYPELTPSIYAATQKIPLRHAYSSSVSDNNPDNYAKVIQEQGEDTNYTKLWWDKN